MLAGMRIGSAECFITLDFAQSVPEGLPRSTDMACSVEASCRGFNGRVEHVWFARDDVHRFLTELRALEANRKGSVAFLNLSSPSDYSPFHFEIFSTNDLGHLAVRADLLQVHYVGDHMIPLRVSVAFDIDAGDLPSLVVEFQRLFRVN